MALAAEVSANVHAPEPRSPGVGLRSYVLVACVAGASLGLELIQTRILSFLYYNHVAYLTVTVVLLGFGISGVFVSLFASRSRNPERTISLLAAGFVISSFVCLGAVSRIPAAFPHAPTAAKLILSYLALVIPFLFSGAVLGWVFMIRATRIGRLYAADLASSSGAVMAFLLLLWPLGADWFVWSCAGLAFAGFLAFSHNRLPVRSQLVVAAIFLLSLIFINRHLIGDKPESYKWLGRASDPGVNTARVEATEWTPITRIDLWSDSARDPVFRRKSADAADTKMITQDGDAFTILWGPHQRARAFQAASHGQSISALSLTYLLNRNPKDALVIGVGGGLDVVTAKAYGAQHVTGVEINPASVALVSGPYRDFLEWPAWDGVKLIRAEGRNYVRSKRNAYDTIVMSGVDTFSALNSGAYVLSENYLYTVDAVEDYLDALKPNGTAAIYRWFFFQGPRESLRLANIFRVAAERRGIPRPDQCIMVISEDQGWSDFHWAATFLKKRPFTPAEVQQVVEAAIEGNPRLSFVYMPNVFPPDVQAARERAEAERDPSTNFARSVYNRLLASTPSARSAFIASYPYRVDAVYDDRPFFFQYYKAGFHANGPAGSGIHLDTSHGAIAYYFLYVLLVICAAISVFCILGPLWFFERRGLEVAGSVPLLLYFACLGAGYMTFELGAMQVLAVYLGDPAWSLALVLAGLLVASGMGAALSSRLSGSLRAISLATVIVATVIVLWLAWTFFLTPRTMQAPLVVRAAVTLACLFPVGVLLGIPFPTAVKALERRNRSFIAWAWGVNGVSSVLASIAAILVAMSLGFRAVVCIAAATYVLAMLSYRWYSRALRTAGVADLETSDRNIA